MVRGSHALAKAPLDRQGQKVRKRNEDRVLESAGTRPLGRTLTHMAWPSEWRAGPAADYRRNA